MLKDVRGDDRGAEVRSVSGEPERQRRTGAKFCFGHIGGC